MMLFKESKIKFYCQLDQVVENYPVLDQSVKKFTWRNRLAQLLRGQKNTNTVYKCPGIYNLLNNGYILPNWFDFSIKPCNDEYKFEYSIPMQLQNYLQNKKFSKEPIGWFSGDDIAYSVPVPHGSMKTLIKINTPWCVELPKDLDLLITSIPYNDNTFFSKNRYTK